MGVVESNTQESESTLSVAVEASMGADFSFGGGSVSTSVSNTVREMMSSTFAMDHSVDLTVNCDYSSG